MPAPFEAWANGRGADDDTAPPGSGPSVAPVPPVGPPPSRSRSSRKQSLKFHGISLELPAGPPPALDLKPEAASSSCHVLLEQEPLVLMYMNFLRAEAFLEMESPFASLSEEEFGIPRDRDVLVAVSQSQSVLSQRELVEMQAAVQDVVKRLQPGCACFVFGEGICSSGVSNMGSGTYSKLKLRVLLYADLVVYVSEPSDECASPPVSECWGDTEADVDSPCSERKSPCSEGSARSARSARSPPCSERSARSARSARSHKEDAIFGPTVSVPDDQCGRVCLERFVTMVKAAMVGNDAIIEQLLVSNSPELRECIGKGAKEISKAIAAASKSGENEGETQLREALGFYVQVIKASMPGAQAATCDLAASFCEYLALNWHREAQVQRRRLARLVDRCLNYAFTWLSLSDERVDSIKKGCRTNPWPVLVVFSMPVLIVLLVYGVPYDRPDAGYPSDGLLQNPLFVFYGWPMTQFCCWYMFPEWVRMSAFPELSVHRACLWVAGVTVASSLGIGAVSAHMGVFPVPFLTVINMVGIVPFLPLIWFCIPREVRRRPRSKFRLSWSAFGLVMLIVIFGLFFPIFNFVFHRLSPLYQNFAVGIFLLARIAFERINKMLARKLDPNMYPLAVALSVYAYELSMCVMMSTMKHTSVLVILVGADICENAFHAWSLWRRRNKWEMEGSRYCIISVMLLREFVELVVPMQLTVIILAFHFGPAKQFNNLVSDFPRGMPPELKQFLTYLVVDIVAEALVFAGACMLLRAQGFKPLCLLRGIVDANLGSYATMALACVMFYLQLQHSHFGCDWSFGFVWVSQEEGVAWSNGIVWSP